MTFSRLSSALYFYKNSFQSFSTNSIASGLNSAVDLRFVRDNIDLIHKNTLQRKSAGDAHAVVALYESYGALQRKVDALRHRRKSLASSSSVSKSSSSSSLLPLDNHSFIEEGRKVKAEIITAETELAACKIELEKRAKELPNLSHEDAPIGPEDNAKEIFRFGSLRKSEGYKLRDHIELCKMLGIADFDTTTSSIAGSGFVTLLNDGVELELAIIQWALSRLRNEGFTIALPPDLALSSLVEACGFNPRHSTSSSTSSSNTSSSSRSNTSNTDGVLNSVSSQIYSIEGSNLCLIGTGEIPLAGIHSGQLLSQRAVRFPLLYAAFSHCFRHEAGGGGSASRGLYRLHQFSKVEMFAFTAPHKIPHGNDDILEARLILEKVQTKELIDTLCPLTQHSLPLSSISSTMHVSHKASDALLCRLVDIQVKLMKELGLSFRVLDMPTEELGSAAHRKVDIEAWMPGRGGNGSFGEVSSASNCIDYQSRRLNCKFKPVEGISSEGTTTTTTTTTTGASTRFVHTLNATGAAVPRLILSILETYQREDGSVEIPLVLQPFMGGKKEIKVKVK
jgi:seryl-tRNA synthetase